MLFRSGTGGHVLPAVNFFNYLSKKNKKVYILSDYRGSNYIKNIDQNLLFKIYSSHYSGNYLFKFIASIKLLLGFVQSIIIFIKLKPKNIISFGSYASSAPLLCFLLFKYFLKTSLYLHEQNSVVGKVNKIFLKFSSKIFMNFDKEYQNIDKYQNKVSVVGLPQRIKENNSINIENKNANKNLI